MRKKQWDVIVVGGGPAGITAALRLARSDLAVLVVEAAIYPGAENWSGAVYFAEGLADPNVLGADELREAPFERRVVKRGFFSCNGFTLAGAEYRNPESFRHCYTVLRPIYDRYLAARARQLGVTLLCETTVDGLIHEGDRVIGVHTDRGPLYGQLVFLAEGDASHLVSKEGFERDAVRSRKSGQPSFLQGVKEVIELEPTVIEERFGVGAGEGACYEILLRNSVSDGRPLRLNMAGFIYTNRSSLSIGLVLPLENLTAIGGDYNRLMEWYKGLPQVRRLIDGGTSTSYGAKIIRGGGLRELPRLVADGVVVGGAATGIGVDFPYPNFTGPACAMGKLFAEAALRLQEEGDEPTAERLEELYVKPLEESNYYSDVEHLADWPAFIEHTDALFDRQIDLLNGSLYAMTRPELSILGKWWRTVQLVGETLSGRWSSTLRDLSGGAGALGIPRFVLKHAPLALLMSIPNTLLALLPFTWGKADGDLDFTFAVEGEEVGRLPAYKRWLGARLRPALARAAGVLYANDGVAIGRKLDRCVGIVMRRLSLWEVMGAVIGGLGFLATRLAQRASDLVGFGARKPDVESLERSFYGRWLAAWQRYTDLSEDGIEVEKSHDAKLSEISYSSEEGSHIKVFFPPRSPNGLADPGESALWGVCPAAVYQLHLDRTLHASVAVNHENCVKCETCWRIVPQNVDWTRFGRHRLTYEVYSEADRDLLRLLGERTLGPAPAIEPDYWGGRIDGGWPEPVGTASDELIEAVESARDAIDLAAAKSDELNRDVWEGPSVLEPGQVEWYTATIEYFASLAEEATAATLAEPIDDWLSDLDLDEVHVQLLRLTEDVAALTQRLRAHAAGRRFFAAAADARQIRDHHLKGLRRTIDAIAETAMVPEDHRAALEERRSAEIVPDPERAARAALRDRIEERFDRQAIRRLEQGDSLEDEEVALLKAAIRAALGAGGVENADLRAVRRDDVIAELGRADASLATIVASHLAAVTALELADAPSSLIGPLRSVDRFAAMALEGNAEIGDSGWTARLPFVPSALAGVFVVRGGDRLASFERGERDLTVEATPAIGLAGAGIAEIRLDSAQPEWEGDWDESRGRKLFGEGARDVAALALGAGSLVVERAVDHARNRIQFPDMFQDIDGRDAVGKFGAVRAHIAHLEASRLALETALLDADWNDPERLEAMLAKVLVTDLFGPDLPSITYRAGQVIGGTAFSEDDIFSKVYRDSSVFPHYLEENATLHGAIGALLAAADGSLLTALDPEFEEALARMENRPILDFEVRRFRAADEKLAAAVQGALRQGRGVVADEAVQDIAGGLATRLFAWILLLVRAQRRLETALPAQRYVEAAQLWADTIEERLIEIDEELGWAGERAELGGLVFQLGDYPDEPTATGGLDFDYRRDVIDAERGYRSGSFLLEPLRLGETRYVPELVWADDVIRSRHVEYLRLFRERFIEGDHTPSFPRHIERLHYIPREDIDWTRERGYFRVVIPEDLGGQGRSKADYYNLCMVSKRLADVSHTLTIQANTSIGTTPMLLGLYQDLAAAEKELRDAIEHPEAVEEIAEGVQRLLDVTSGPGVDGMEAAFGSLSKDASARLGRGRVLKKAVFGRFLSQLRRAGAAAKSRDLDAFRSGLEKALTALDGWENRAAAELDEIPNRRYAHEFFLRLISARMISAFALTEPSAGSDTARIRSEARLEARRIHTDPDGIQYFYLDEEAEEGRRNVADMRRFEFDYESSKILYRIHDDADPTEVISQEYSYEEGEKRYRYLMIGDRRVDIHDMALIRERDGAQVYEFYVLNGAKMWITNGHIAGVEALYARTPAGVTGFMVDALTDGFIIGKDEEKTGQRGSPTNEITLTNVRVPRECVIGIEGRGQENALETLNVGRTGLCVSSAAGIQQLITDARDSLATSRRGSRAWVRYRLGLALEEMFAVESLAYNLIGLFDDDTSDALRIESSAGKLFGTDGLHRTLHYLEPVYGIDGQTRRHLIEKDRRDARVMTIYEGTNEIQQFLLLKDLIDMIGPRIEASEAAPRVVAGDSRYDDEARILDTMLNALHERVRATRAAYGSTAWQRALLQPIFFRLSRMVALIKVVDSALHRAHWIATRLTDDDDGFRRDWADRAARGAIARTRREFWRLVRGFDHDIETLQAGGRTAELKLAETVFDEADGAWTDEPEKRSTRRIDRTPIDARLRIAVVAEQAPKLAPRPRLDDGQLAEHVHTFTVADRRALELALDLKRAAPDRIDITLVSAGPLHTEGPLRFGLAAGADRGVLLNTGDESFTEAASARALADALRGTDVPFDLILVGSTAAGPSGGRLPLRLAEELRLDWAPEISDLWFRNGVAVCASERFPSTIELPTPAVTGVSSAADDADWTFTTEGFLEALAKPLQVIPFPADAERSDEELAAAGAAVSRGDGDQPGSVEPERAAELLIDAGDLGNGASAPEAPPYRGEIRHGELARIGWEGVVLIPELDSDEITRAARGPLQAARAIAERTSLPLDVLVFSEPLTEERRRRIAGRLAAAAPFTGITFAEDPALAEPSPHGQAAALVRLLGPDVAKHPAYVFSSEWLAEALPLLAAALRRADLPTEELPGVSRVEFPEPGRVDFLRPVHDRRLRAHRVREARREITRIIWCAPDVSGIEVDGQAARAEPEVQLLELGLDYDLEADALARALAEAREELGVVTLENAEFVIDVGAGLGSVDNLETVVDPLKSALEEAGVPHVVIGATRKVTMDLSWLPDEHQIGQTGVSVNPRILIALGVSGAPQHIDYVGERAVIFAFNMDARAPIMTLNQRRERPKVYPVVGDLFRTVPKFIQALREAGASDQ